MKRVLILLGPTGVGKTGASVIIARELDTEIISADSMLIYRGMDIGTAKPSQQELGAVRHHMISVADPSESFSAGQYIEMVVPIIERLHGSGRVPLIAGGTGLYIKAITRGIFSGPSADWGLRDQLLALEEESPGALYALLREMDPDAAQRIERRDTRRIVRAMEVCIRSNDRISRLQERLTKPLPYDFIKVGLTRARGELYRMIDSRVEQMMAQGLEGEVKSLLASHPDRTPLQAIGYKEFIACLKGEVSLDETVRLIKRNSRRYAKRQFTWFRKEQGIRWIDITGMPSAEDISAAVLRVLADEYGLYPADKKTP
ncbi:MAG: tRNA (adenosine(37)-N6)-dimethylallyltransferase MiaA [Nitrospiraceae bacterium]|nr:tRNA (adenosine(37)-N6)-dimethylallyltransferase MiaA [Nitrospiraceae bacterium]